MTIIDTLLPRRTLDSRPLHVGALVRLTNPKATPSYRVLAIDPGGNAVDVLSHGDKPSAFPMTRILSRNPEFHRPDRETLATIAQHEMQRDSDRAEIVRLEAENE